MELLSALRYLCQKGIEYQTLNTKKIFIDERGNSKIDITHLEDNKELVNAYMSPEALRGNKEGIASDIWSLGCIAYELLCLQVVYYLTVAII